MPSDEYSAWIEHLGSDKVIARRAVQAQVLTWLLAVRHSIHAKRRAAMFTPSAVVAIAPGAPDVERKRRQVTLVQAQAIVGAVGMGLLSALVGDVLPGWILVMVASCAGYALAVMAKDGQAPERLQCKALPSLLADEPPRVELPRECVDLITAFIGDPMHEKSTGAHLRKVVADVRKSDWGKFVDKELMPHMARKGLSTWECSHDTLYKYMKWSKDIEFVAYAAAAGLEVSTVAGSGCRFALKTQDYFVVPGTGGTPRTPPRSPIRKDCPVNSRTRGLSD